MSATEPKPGVAATELQARELEVSLEAASDELERNGPVPADEVRQTLDALFAELAAEQQPE